MINYYITEFLPQGDNIGQLEHVLTTRDEEHTHAYFDIIIPLLPFYSENKMSHPFCYQYYSQYILSEYKYLNQIYILL